VRRQEIGKEVKSIRKYRKKTSVDCAEKNLPSGKQAQATEARRDSVDETGSCWKRVSQKKDLGLEKKERGTERWSATASWVGA